MATRGKRVSKKFDIKFTVEIDVQEIRRGAGSMNIELFVEEKIAEVFDDGLGHEARGITDSYGFEAVEVKS